MAILNKNGYFVYNLRSKNSKYSNQTIPRVYKGCIIYILFNYQTPLHLYPFFVISSYFYSINPKKK